MTSIQWGGQPATLGATMAQNDIIGPTVRGVEIAYPVLLGGLVGGIAGVLPVHFGAVLAGLFVVSVLIVPGQQIPTRRNRLIAVVVFVLAAVTTHAIF